jgi:hypothetical protein
MEAEGCLSALLLIDFREFLTVRTHDNNDIQEDLVKKILLHFAALSLILAFTAIASERPAPHIKGKEVDYAVGGVAMKGYLAFDKDRTGRRPGIIVLPEWWGISAYERRRARMLAALLMSCNLRKLMEPQQTGVFTREKDMQQSIPTKCSTVKGMCGR